MELYPIDYIRKGTLGESSLSICCEDTRSVRDNIISTILLVIELIREREITWVSKSEKECVGEHARLMRIRTSHVHVARNMTIPTIMDVWDLVRSHYSIQ